MNKVILIGNLTKDVELKYLPSGSPVARFTVATSEKIKDKEVTEFTNCFVWGRLAEQCSASLSKGSECAVEGKLEYRNYQDKNGNNKTVTEVNALKVVFLSPKHTTN